MTFRMRSRVLNMPEVPQVDELSIHNLYSVATKNIMSETKSETKPDIKPVLKPDVRPVPPTVQNQPQKIFYKTTLYNCKSPVVDTISTIVTFPFDGTRYNLKSILISLQKPQDSYPFTIGVSRSDTNQQLAEHLVKPEEHTIKLDLFGNVPTSLSTLNVDCFADQKYDKEVFVTAVEIIMTEIIF